MMSVESNEKLKKEIINILISEQIIAKVGSEGEYERILCVDSEDYSVVANKICVLIQAITDPQNQPNQFGIIL